mmetsp:Transcript_5195/g.22056  ORF Transcript_5195/g.22056 Transcript_5195/m.22056 type:complete len:230 (-) Transcript_5195:1067-1756(-)
MTGVSPPRSSTPLCASAPTICTPQRRAVRPASASARESSAPFPGFTSVTDAIKSAAASSAGRSARAANASAAADPASSVSNARRPAESTSLRARDTASATFCFSVDAFREGDAVITRAVSSCTAANGLVSFSSSVWFGDVGSESRQATSHSSAATAASRSVACSAWHWTSRETSRTPRSIPGSITRACAASVERGGGHGNRRLAPTRSSAPSRSGGVVMVSTCDDVKSR